MTSFFNYTQRKAFVIALFFSVALVLFSCENQPKSAPDTPSMKQVVEEALDFSAKQSLKMAASLKDKDSLLPKTVDLFGNLQTCKSDWWVSGFFPGQLWYLYENTQDPAFKTWAENYSNRVADQQYTTDNHDVGFMIFCSFGNGYRITANKSYEQVILNASKSLSTRYNDIPKVIQSWGANSQWDYPVIIDNMMNLELLLWTAEHFKEPSFKEIAITHANTTIQHHFRKDYSSYHVVSYDTVSGKPQAKNTAQGYSDDSAWARGQAWGLYGYTVMYRFTQDPKYLEQAQRIASFILSHPNLPEDKVPYWDFNAPNIPDTYRDASAAAIICSALLELSTYLPQKDANEYLNIAEIQLRALSSSTYRNALGNNGNFILKHSVGHLPAKSEVDVPLTYADYYFVEALLRYKDLKGY